MNPDLAFWLVIITAFPLAAAACGLTWAAGRWLEGRRIRRAVDDWVRQYGRPDDRAAP